MTIGQMTDSVERQSEARNTKQNGEIMDTDTRHSRRREEWTRLYYKTVYSSVNMNEMTIMKHLIGEEPYTKHNEYWKITVLSVVAN